MREIKFRLIRDGKVVGYEKFYPGKRRGDGSWEAYPNWLYSKDGEIWSAGNYIFHTSKDQYTGLKDKNGAEIYEGDRLKSSEPLGEYQSDYAMRGIGIVLWNESKAGYVLKWVDSRDGEHFPLLSDMINRYNEIIGNIHENPELLDG